MSVVILTGCLVYIFFFRTGEPSYHGKTLSELISASHVGGGKSPFDDELMTGISAMGTNVYPGLFRLVSARDGALRAKIINRFNHQRLIHVHLRTAADKQSIAEYVFHYFGTNLTQAAPGLIALTRDPDPLVRRCAINCLIAAESQKSVLLPVLTERLQDSERPVRQSAASYIDIHYPDEARELNVSRFLFSHPPVIVTNSSSNFIVKWTRQRIDQ